jgi:UDP-glucose 4-epimerase
VVVLRYFNIYGPRMDQMDMGRVIPIFIGQLLRDEPLTVIGDGLQTRSFTYVDDAIRATLAAGLEETAVGEVINIGADEEVNILCLAELMIQLSGSRSIISFVNHAAVYGPSYEDIRRRVPSTRKMQEILSVIPKMRLQDGLRRTIEWFRQRVCECQGRERSDPLCQERLCPGVDEVHRGC